MSTGERIGFTVPSAPWTIILPKGDYVNVQRKVKPDGKYGYIIMDENNNSIIISFFIEPVKDYQNSKACRDMIWKLGNPAWVNPQNVIMFEFGDVSCIEFLTPTFRGSPVNQQNLYAEFVKDGFWVDLHVSKIRYKPEEHTLFEQLLRAIKFEPKTMQSQ